MNELSEAITNLVRVTVERDLAYAKCEIDPDYFCSEEDQRVNKSTARLVELLAAVIDERVDARLAKRSETNLWSKW